MVVVMVMMMVVVVIVVVDGRLCRRLGQVPVAVVHVVLLERLVLVSAHHGYRVHGHIRRRLPIAAAATAASVLAAAMMVMMVGRFPVMEHAGVHAEALPAVGRRHHDDRSVVRLLLLTLLLLLMPLLPVLRERPVIRRVPVNRYRCYSRCSDDVFGVGDRLGVGPKRGPT